MWQTEYVHIELLLQERPHARVLYISGYLQETLIEEGSLSDGDHFLQKPFLPATLIDSVRRIL